MAPWTLGGGQVYAGDPLRGALVGAGTYGAMGVGVGLGYGLTFLNADAMKGDRAIPVIIGSVALVTLGYAVWAVDDAVKTAERATKVTPSPSVKPVE